MKEALSILFVDDNPLDLYIGEKLVQRLGTRASVLCFEGGQKAIDYLSSRPRQGRTLLFVDIQMPTMDGFAFVEAFEALLEPHRQYCHLFMLSSSINDRDRDRASSYELVRAFLQKPLSKDSLARTLETYGGGSEAGESMVGNAGEGQ